MKYRVVSIVTSFQQVFLSSESNFMTKINFPESYPFKCLSYKIAKHTQTIRRQITGEFFECVWPFCGIGA